MASEGAAGSSPSPCPSHEGVYLPLLSSQPLSSTPKTFANLVLCIVGSGVLGLPYTFSRIGWVMGFLTLIVSSAIVYHGMMLQVYSKHRLHRSRHGTHLVIASYGDLMYHAFGRWGQLAVDVLLTLSTFACAISYITFISQNAASIASSFQGMTFPSSDAFDSKFTHAMASNDHGNLSNLPNQLNMYSEAQEFLKSRYDNLSELSSQNQSLPELSHNETATVRFASLNLSFSGASPPDGILGGLSWLSASTYTWLVFPFEVALAAIPSVTFLAPFSAVGDTINFAGLAAVMVSEVLIIQKTSSLGNMKAFGSMLAVPSAFGVGVYAFQSSGIMIPIEAAMKEPLRLGSVMGLAFVLSGLIYALFAVLGYAAFGENTQQVITLNLESGIETIVVKVAICFSLFLAFPLVLNPMFELVERRFSQRKISLGFRTLLVFAIFLLATTVKQFTVFLSLAGSSISCLAGFILPAAVHIKVIKEDVDNPPTFLIYAADISLIVFGVIFGAFGTTVSFLELLESA